MKRGIVVFAAIAIVATGAVSVMADSSVEHCDAGDETAVKVEGQGTFVVDDVTVTVDGASVYFTDAFGNPVEVEFCVKAAGSNSGVQTGSSFTVDWVNNGGNTPDISYVVLFGEVEEEEPPSGEESPVEEEEPPAEEEPPIEEGEQPPVEEEEPPSGEEPPIVEE